MCGISGIYHFNESPEQWRSLLYPLVRELRHRGPDEEGYFCEPHISMGVRRLKVIDLTSGHQPISNEDGTIHVVFNGEIYRYEALRKALEEKGHQLKTQTDTEVVIHLYEECGFDFLQHLDGMFAFALWDSRYKRLILARDRFGIKPLFYTVGLKRGLLAFCSEIIPLLKIPGLSKSLDPIAIDQFFALSYILHPRSVYENIKKLSPGCYLLVEGSEYKEIHYWDLNEIDLIEQHGVSNEELDECISDSVKTMMRCDVPCGAFLSGGLDSSTIVYHMVKNSDKPISTFSVRFSEKSFDESKKASLLSKYFGTKHHEIWIKHDHVYQAHSIIGHFGEPFADPSLIPTYNLARIARQEVTVALSGDGGDEILGGYLTYVASLLTKFVAPCPELLLDLLSFSASLLRASMKRASFDYKLKKFLSGCRLPPLEHHAAWKIIFPANYRKILFARDICEQIEEAIDKPIFHQWNDLFKKNGISQLSKYQYLDIKTFLADNNLPRVDRMSMANSLEVRLPFLDMKVVNSAFKLRPIDRVRRFNTKVSLRKIMKHRLPPEIVRMRKRGFAVPLSFWFRGPLKKFVKETLATERIKATGIICPKIVSGIVDSHFSARENFHRQIWSLICFVIWHEQSKANKYI